MSNKVTIDNLADAIVEEFESYAVNLGEAIQNDIKQISKECVAEVKSKSPKRTGEYAKNWTSKITQRGNGKFVITVYNKKYYRLTHLLEFGHAKVNGGRVNGKPHIRPAEQRATDKLMQKIKTEAQG